MSETIAMSPRVGKGLQLSERGNDSVLNELRVLIEDPACVLYLPPDAYVLAAPAKRDPRVIESPLGRSLEVFDVVSDEERFNFSVRCKKDVKVLLAPGPGQRVRPENRQVYRTYNIIRDGELVMEALEAVVSEDTFELLQRAGVLPEGEEFRPAKVYRIALDRLPLIGRSWAQPIILRLVERMREELLLKVQVAELRHHLKKFIPDSEQARTPSSIYTEHPVLVPGQQVEKYEVECARYKLVDNREPNVIDQFKDLSFRRAHDELVRLRRRHTAVRYLIRSVIFAMERTGSQAIPWDAGKVRKRGRYEKMEQFADFQGEKLKRTTWKEEVERVLPPNVI